METEINSASTEINTNNMLADVVFSDFDILSKIRRADERQNKIQGWESNNIIGDITKLFEYGFVEVGYRAQCGSIHKSQKSFSEFSKIIKALEKKGVKIEIEIQKHKNAYATNNGGFWNSSVFKIAGYNVC